MKKDLFFNIRNKSGGKCLERKFSFTYGGQIVQSDCDTGQALQNWYVKQRFLRFAESTYRIVHYNEKNRRNVV
ncbi:MAG: hypothetical protein ACMUEM_01880 [Flavobacteriales bacterium AspAUS03]